MVSTHIKITIAAGILLMFGVVVANYMLSDNQFTNIPEQGMSSVSTTDHTAVFVSSTTVTSTDSQEKLPKEENDGFVPEEIKDLPVHVLHTVPFTPQAPFGDWSDPRQQDGCEEGSVVMAWYWLQQKELTRERARDEIIALAEWEKENYGESRDTSAADTLTRLLQEYYGYRGGRVVYDITADEVKKELSQGNLVIIPFDGQVLMNPHFKAPGPERHMLLVIGYDDEKKQFITNDPGTSYGKDFRYSYDNFEASFRDYETGSHVPIIGRRSAMIVIEPVAEGL